MECPSVFNKSVEMIIVLFQIKSVFLNKSAEWFIVLFWNEPVLFNKSVE